LDENNFFTVVISCASRSALRLNMDDNTPIANFLNSFVDEGKTKQDQATAVTKIFIDQWITTLGDCKKFTVEDLKEWKVPAMVVKGLDEQGFLKPSTGIMERLNAFLALFAFIGGSDISSFT